MSDPSIFSRALGLQTHTPMIGLCGAGDQTLCCVHVRQVLSQLRYIPSLLLPYLVSLSAILDKNFLGDNYTLIISVSKRRGCGSVMMSLSFCYSERDSFQDNSLTKAF